MLVINYNELNNYLVENKDAIIYVSKLNDESIRLFENKFKNIINKNNLNNKILYLDLTEELKENNIVKEINKKYGKEMTEVPTIVIIKDGKAVKGLTTAATLWCSAAIGILCSANLLLEAITGTLFILFTNIILRTVNSKINHLSGNINYNLYNFSIIAEEHKEKEITKIIKSIVKENHSTITSLEINDTENGNIKIDLCITVDSDNDNLSNEMMQKLLNKKEVISISLNKKDKRFLFEEEEL